MEQVKADFLLLVHVLSSSKREGMRNKMFRRKKKAINLCYAISYVINFG